MFRPLQLRIDNASGGGGAIRLPLYAKSPARLALLIGNQSYTDKVGPLKNPHNDVDIVAASLKKLGFKVQVLKDASYRKMDIALRRHVDRIRRAGDGAISFFYYSGHGVANPETKRNFLLPVDVTEADDANIWYEAFQQNEIINRLVKDADNAIHYVIFDACRDELNLTGPRSKSLGQNKGFVAVDDTSGILIAYATAPGRTASDGGGKGGPYANALAVELLKPGIEAVTMFRNVQIKVKQSIGQDPWLSFPALPPVYLAGENAIAEKPPSARALPPSFAEQTEIAYWNSVKDSDDPALLRSYLEQFPNGAFAGLARLLADRLEVRQRQKKLALAKPVEPAGVANKTTGTVAAPAAAKYKDLAIRAQVALKNLGCYAGRIDGDFGARSRRALARALGLNPANATISSAALKKLLKIKISPCRNAPSSVSTNQVPSHGRRVPSRSRNVPTRERCEEYKFCKMTCAQKAGTCEACNFRLRHKC